MKGRDEIIAEMLLWSQDFIEQPHRVFGGLPICPFAKAAWLRQSIRFEVLCFAAADLFEPDGRVMTLIGEFLGGGKLETLFVIHPEPERIGALALEAGVARLNARLAACDVTLGLQVFEAHPESGFCIGGDHTRRSPYPSFQVLRRSLLKDASDTLLTSSYYDHFTPEMLRAVGMPHDKPSTSMPPPPREPASHTATTPAIIPRPAVNLVVYHGLLAPHARWLSRAVRYGRPHPEPPARHVDANPRAAGTPGAWTWAALMPRVLDLDVLACPRCGGRLRVLATVQDPRAVQAILAHRARSGAPAPPGPAPPAPAALP